MSSAGPGQAAESGSFLKKRTKKLCEFGFGLSWRTEAEIIKSFLLLFFKKEVLPCLSVCLAPWHRPHPDPPPERGREILGSYDVRYVFSKR